MNDSIEALLPRILPRVQKPARYVGGEYNQTVKDLSEVELRVAFCFPDTYEIGMSNLGIRILYGVMNRGRTEDRARRPQKGGVLNLQSADQPLPC